MTRVAQMSPPAYKRARPIGVIAEETVTKDDKEAFFWEHFKKKQVYSQSGPVTACAFSPSDPRELLVAASLRVTKRFGEGFHQEKNIFVTEGGVCSLSHRSDGRLIAVGTASGKVIIIESSTRLLLRELIGHVGPVKAVSFLAGKRYVASAGDDQHVCLWEVADGSLKWKAKVHSDFVRALASDTQAPEIFATGSYDGKVAVWEANHINPSFVLDHGLPVEAVAFLPAQKLASAGGNSIKIWNLTDGAQVHELRLHHKTITSIVVSQDLQFLLSSSLDRSVKILRIRDWQLMAKYKVESAILSISLDMNMCTMAIGTTDGAVNVFRRKSFHPVCANEGESKKTPQLKNEDMMVEDVSLLLPSAHRGKELQQFDRLLKSFRYRMALDAILARKSPELLAQAVRELTRREGLQVALSGRSDAEISEIIDLVVQGLPFPRMSSSLLELAFSILEIYDIPAYSGPHTSTLRKLRSCLSRQIKTIDQMLELEGQLALIRKGW